MRNEDILLIKKMIKYCDDIGTLMTKFDMDFERYKTDISFQYSCNMCIIQIGELANRVSEEIKGTGKNIPWRAIKGMRNLHAHDYENVDMEIVWNTLLEDIPMLRESLKNYCSISSGGICFYGNRAVEHKRSYKIIQCIHQGIKA